MTHGWGAWVSRLLRSLLYSWRRIYRPLVADRRFVGSVYDRDNLSIFDPLSYMFDESPQRPHPPYL